MSDTLREIAAEVARLGEQNARLLQRLADGERRMRHVSRGVLRVQEAERGRLARELHDGLGQSLTALKIQLERLEQSSADAVLRAHLAELRALADDCLQEARQLSHRLRPQMLDELGLSATLRWMARDFGRRAGLAVELSEEGDGPADPDAEALVYRVAQEALTNAAKHARAASAALRLRRAPTYLRLEVRDDGAGFDPAAVLARADEDAGFGLRGLRDRVQLLGGRFELSASPGAGSALTVEVPLEPRAR